MAFKWDEFQIYVDELLSFIFHDIEVDGVLFDFSSKYNAK